VRRLGIRTNRGQAWVRVVIEELRIDRNLGALLWSLGIAERRLRVQKMKTDVNDTGGSKRIGQYNHPDTFFRIVSGV
jgi:hypothetical protein